VKFGVIRFPGSCDEVDAVLACERVPGSTAQLLWHRDADLHGAEAIVVPGGFSYGDYLRAGAIARFSPVMESVVAFARAGGLVLGICNGFQVLCEAGLLPGALLPNEGLRFICRQVELVAEDFQGPFGAAIDSGDRLSIPVKHMSGRYFAPDDQLDALESAGRIAFRYAAGENPNGSVRDIAGVVNEAGNVLGLMPHPEHAVDLLTGSDDGLVLFRALAGTPKHMTGRADARPPISA
jgi:phosphoribosylformylglycinamidine synthase I